MLIPTESLAETIRLMRAVRDAREALDESAPEHAVAKCQLKVIADRSARSSDVHGQAVAALAGHAQRYPFTAD
jgi:hypothetical protein